MPLFRSSTSFAPVQPRSWLRRHKVVATLVVVVLVAAGLAAWRPWKRCDTGMTTVGSSSNCVGLDVGNTSFGPNDAMGDLRERIATHNSGVGTDFVTVVVMDNMTPDPASASIIADNVRHGVAGALTAASRANEVPVARETLPQVKLKLANYGSTEDEARAAAKSISDARDDERIIAVVGLGQSLAPTRLAASLLSDAGLAVVSGMASADDMNQHFDGGQKYIQRFYRITPTNIDAAKAAATYLRSRPRGKLLLVHDTNPSDIYSLTLGEAFKDAYREKFGEEVTGELPFTSPDGLNKVSREKYMEGMFADVYSRICAEHPDQIYFAGRGTDLAALLRTIAANGTCGNRLNMDIITGDAASSLLGWKQPEFAPQQVNVVYTSVATRGQWDRADPAQPENQANYQKFEDEFHRLGLDDVDARDDGTAPGHVDALIDGYAMSVYDAVLVATAAARGIPSAPGENPKQVSDWIKKFNCVNPFHGATGKIAYKTDPAVQGDPVDKAMPILRLDSGGRPHQEDLVWPSGQPFGQQSCD